MIEQITESLNTFVEQTYAVNEILAQPFAPIADLVYRPVQAFMKMTDLPETTATLFVTFQISFILCLGLNFFKDPQMRKWYSTLTGLLLGFYFHGVSYLVCIAHFSCVYPLMKYLPREKTLYPVVGLAALIMTVRSFFMFWESNLNGSLRV